MTDYISILKKVMLNVGTPGAGTGWEHFSLRPKEQKIVAAHSTLQSGFLVLCKNGQAAAVLQLRFNTDPSSKWKMDPSKYKLHILKIEQKFRIAHTLPRTSFRNDRTNYHIIKYTTLK